MDASRNEDGAKSKPGLCPHCGNPACSVIRTYRRIESRNRTTGLMNVAICRQRLCDPPIGCGKKFPSYERFVVPDPEATNERGEQFDPDSGERDGPQLGGVED